MSNRRWSIGSSVLRPLRWALTGAALTSIGALMLGCGGVSPGDYVIYRVALSDAKRGSSCYPDKKIPPNEKSDSDSFLASTDFILYAGPDDNFYLDTGSATLEGTGDADVYTFVGKTVDVEYASSDGTGDKITTTDTTTIQMTVDGKAVTGTVSEKVSITCRGNNCGDAIPSCTTTTNFVGTEVDDVELKHEV